jgi:hypothetical protein
VSGPGARPPDGPWDEDDDDEPAGSGLPGDPGDELDELDELGWSLDDDNGWGEETTRWPMTWRGLYPRERWLWFQHLWVDVCTLRERYRLAVRSGWWEDDVRLETLAALAAWVDRYDSGEWDDPPGKLALLFDLERIAGMLRDGLEPFHPARDHPAFLSHIVGLGCQPPQSQ